MSNKYYIGAEQAVLSSDDVEAPWKSEPKALMLLNRAFEIYFDAYTAINLKSDGDLQRDLFRSLDEAARYWNLMASRPGGVSSLYGGFEHLEKNDGHWKDAATANYYGGIGGTGFGLAVAPSCAVSFFRAVDDKIKKLQEVLNKVAEGMEQVKEGQDEENTNWGKVGKGLETVEKYGNYAKKLLWLAPEKLQEGSNVVLEWDEKILKGYGYADKLMKIAASNRPVDTAIFIALPEILGYLPILGSFYGRMFAEIPGMAARWEEFSDNYWARYGMQTYRRSQGMGPMFQ